MKCLLKYIALFIFIVNSSVLTGEIIIDDYDDSAYPEVTLHTYFFSDNDFQIPEKDFITLEENNLEINDYELLCSEVNLKKNRSYILSLDASTSMTEEGLNLLKKTAENFINIALGFNPKNEILIQAFGNKSYVLQGFSSDRELLLNSLENIRLFGFTDFDAAYFESSYSALKLADYAKYSTSIVTISDAKSAVSVDEVISIANNKNVRIFPVILNTEINPSFEKISGNTSGRYLFSRDLVNIEKFINRILFVSNDAEPCRIIYKSSDCEYNKIVSIEYEDSFAEYNYFVNPSKFAYIDYPANNYLEFDTENEKKKISLKAVNSDILINSITNNSNNFRLIQNIENYLLEKDSLLIIELEYFNESEDYLNAEFIINSDVCFGKSFWCSNGRKNSIEKKSLLLQFPNGGELFQARNDSVLKWSGISPGDTISVELSTNNGESWNKISNRTFAGLESRILFPDIESDECLIRIKQLSQSLMDEDIHIFDKHTNDILDLKHTEDGKHLFSADINGDIIKWNLETYEFENYTLRNLLGLNDFDINSNGNLLAYAAAEPSIQIYNVEGDSIDLKLISSESIIKKFEWNKSKGYFAGFSNNKLLIWNYPATNPVKSYSFENENLTDMAFSDDYIAVSTFESYVHLINLESLQVSKSIKIASSAINSIDFNSTGTTLIITLNDDEIIVYNPFSETKLKTFIDKTNPVSLADWSKFNNLITTANSGNQIKLWSLAETKEVFTYDYHNDIITASDWSPVSDYIATAEGSGIIHYWSASNIPFENQALQADTSDDVFSIRKPVLNLKDVSFNPIFSNSYSDTTVSGFAINTGKIEIEIDSVTKSGNQSSSFIINSALPEKIPIDSAFDISVTFKPQGIGEHKTDLLFHSGLKVFRANLMGFANEKIVDILSDEIDFGSVNMLEKADTVISVFKNISGTNISVQNVEILNGNSPFEVENFNNSVNNNEDLVLNIAYNPQNLTFSGDLARIILSNDTEIFVTLNGRGVAPEIIYPENIVFEELRCSDLFSDTLITVSNQGDNYLRIDSIEIAGSNAFEIILPQNIISAGETAEIPLEFNPTKKGIQTADVTIYTNYQSNLSNLIQINVSGYLDSIDLRFDKTDINFIDLNKNQVYYDTVIVGNFGTDTVFFESEYNYDYFTLIPENAALIPESEMQMVIVFKGASEDGQYREEFTYLDYCGTEHNIKLNAIIGKSEAQIQTISELNLGETVCGNQISETFEIENTGLTDLIIYEMNFSDNSFYIEENSNDIVIKSGEILNFTLKTEEISNGDNLSELIISSNAENSIQGETIIPVSIFNNYTKLNFASDTLYFNNALENIEYERYDEVLNSGTIPFVFEESYSSEHFEINDFDKDKLNENQSANLTVVFKGGTAGNIYKEYIDFTDSCGNTYRLYMIADVIGYAQAGLKTGDFTAKIGDTLSLPVYLYSPENVNLPDVNSYSAQLSFNANLMYPLEQDFNSFVAEQMRYIEIENIPGQSESGSPSVKLDFLVTLGDTNYTDIYLTNSFSPDDESIAVETQKGSLQITGICEDGGERYITFNGTLILEQNSPNPANDNTLIKFYLIEKGSYSLDLYDIKGNYLSEIDSGYSENGGEYEVSVDVSHLSSGNYIYILTTDSHKVVKKMTVKR